MNFRMWLERQFLELPRTAKVDIERFVKKLFSQVIPYQQKTGHFPTDKNGKEYLGSVSTGGHSISVYVSHGESSGGYDPINDTITIDYDILSQGEAKVIEGIYHELLHATDTKSQLPRSSTELRNYQHFSQNGDPRYYQNPMEFDAYGSTIAEYIRRSIRNIKDEQQQQRVIDELKNWLRQGSPEHAPNFLKQYGKLPQQAWRQNPKLWRMFQQRLYNLLEKLTPLPPPKWTAKLQ